MAAELFLVGTPIGNLGDITLRAIETLRSVVHVAAEDTRRTRALLSHLGITGKRLHALDAHASAGKIRDLCDSLEAGESVALVTDAGMPSVSDPGRELVHAARARGIKIVPVPGPSAVTAAVAASGIVESSFLFLGFLPRQGGKRRAAIERIAKSPDPVVLFEAPHRMPQTLRDLAQAFGEREVVICRELTKLHEELRSGTLNQLAAEEVQFRGELTLVIAGAGATHDSDTEQSEAELEAQIEARLREGASVKTVAMEFAQSSSRPRKELYAIAQRLHDSLLGEDEEP